MGLMNSHSIILVANVGSTSFKFKLFEMPGEKILSTGKIENIGSEESQYQLRAGERSINGSQVFADYESAIKFSIDFLTDSANGILPSLEHLDAVGFKTVHGKGLRECRVLDEKTLAAMEAYNFLAPSHNPPYIAAIRIFAKLIPKVPRVGLFEPAFHRNLPEYATTYGIPYELAKKHGIQKYGFHGASHRYISERTPEFLGIPKEKSRIISCHLGGSSSICAIKDGRSIDVSMGFSPQSGLLNAKRTGDLDPFVPLFLQKEEGLTVDQVADLLNARSGLLGISGVSGDMKKLIDAAEQGNKRAHLAIDTFCYGILHYVGAYYVALQGLDALVFTGGIGEKSPLIREKVCQGLEFLGIEIDKEVNQNVTGEQVISTANSKAHVAVIPTNEELVVAREVKKLLDRKKLLL